MVNLTPMKHFWSIFILFTILWSQSVNKDVKHLIVNHKGITTECFIDSIGYDFLYFIKKDSVDMDSIKLKKLYYVYNDLNRVFHYSWSFEENVRRMENRTGKLFTVSGDTIEFIDIKFYKDMIEPEIFIKTGPENSDFISMFDVEKIETDYSIISSSVERGFYYSFFAFMGMILIEIYSDWDKEKRMIPQVWTQFDDLMPMVSIVGLRETGVTYESFTSLIPISILTSMLYDIIRNKNKFYFTPVYEEEHFGRNMYVFSFKKLVQNQLNSIVYKLEGTKLGGKLIGWMRKR